MTTTLSAQKNTARPVRTTALAILFGLAACAPQPAIRSDGSPIVMPPEVLNTITAQQLARQVAGECSRYTFNFGREQSEQRALIPVVRASGLTERDLRLWANNIPDDVQRDLQGRVIGFIDEHDILMTDPDSFCAAGDTEVADGSEIGSYLIAR
ncbi:DUF5333 family protein [Roseobacter sp. HKCCA0434]|uniref:DUF5333 family protein n=1 Tax=Roseobacter sp. HKCCA0434 TaxID=3079297 RepID=UPI002905A84D|nr:DUF5333 family protein [Roseobacter sp. HKCCA0434]